MAQGFATVAIFFLRMVRLIVPKLLAFVAGSAGVQASVDPIRIDPGTGYYVDASGRVRIFHGVNIVYKEYPWYPETETFNPTDSLDPETMGNLKKWGMNVVRLGVMWPGVEPAPGVIDKTYLSKIRNITQQLASYDVYTIADLHQDIGSRRFCGEGFPEFYIDDLLEDTTSAVARAAPFPAPMKADISFNSTGFPNMTDCLSNEFAGYYLTEQVGAMWNELYTPGSDLNLGFSRFWGAVANEFRDAPELLAYELLNEPNGFCLEGSAKGCENVFGELFGNSVEVEKLTPLYRSAAEAIRSANAAQPIIYEQTVLLPKVLAAPFPGPVLENDDQQGLAYHIYCIPGDGAGAVSSFECKVAQDLFWHTYAPFLRRHQGIGGFMTEFGAVGGNPLELKHLDRLFSMVDDQFQSWAYWELKTYKDFTTANAAESLYDGDGKIETTKLATLSRTYAQAIAGEPKSMKFDSETARFTLRFKPNATISKPTVIYFNEELHYPHGYISKVTPSGCLDVVQEEPNHLFLSVAAVSDCQDVTVEVWPSSAQDQVVV
uniref:Endoglycoceramidase n=1 Tax=Noctiluca scintillans TaxID=2966 RepID=A0A7S1FFA1_NOCSC